MSMRDGRMPRAICEEHTSYTRGCSGCRTANAAYARTKRKLNALRVVSGYVDAIGTQRRLSALHALGFTYADLSRRLGMKDGAVSVIMGQRYVRHLTAEKVRKLYDDLWLVQPDADDRAGKTNLTRTRNRASALGFESPLAWDDREIDLPLTLAVA